MVDAADHELQDQFANAPQVAGFQGFGDDGQGIGQKKGGGAEGLGFAAQKNVGRFEVAVGAAAGGLQLAAGGEGGGDHVAQGGGIHIAAQCNPVFQRTARVIVCGIPDAFGVGTHFMDGNEQVALAFGGAFLLLQQLDEFKALIGAKGVRPLGGVMFWGE